MCFLDHAFAVGNIEELLFIESGGHCDLLSCFETLHGLLDFQSEDVDLGELEVDLVNLILREHRWI
jgi:hypothetical protein